MTNYKSVLKVIKTDDGREIRQPEVVAESVVEQRVSHFLMGLAIIGTMTGPILVVLHLIPRALFAGVFFVVGWGGLEGNGIMAKFIYLIREPRFVQPDEPLLQIPKTRIMFYLFWQIFGITATVGVSQTIAGIGTSALSLLKSTAFQQQNPHSINTLNPIKSFIHPFIHSLIHPLTHPCVLCLFPTGFPVLIIALIPLRWNLLPKIFTAKELRAMDAPTAENAVVLASMGGKPHFPESDKDDDDDRGDESPGVTNDADGAAKEVDRGVGSSVGEGGLRERERKREAGWSEV